MRPSQSQQHSHCISPLPRLMFMKNKNFLRRIQPKPWANPFPLPIASFRKCCGGERGPQRTPRSELTWFKCVWLIVKFLIDLLTNASDEICRSISVLWHTNCDVHRRCYCTVPG